MAKLWTLLLVGFFSTWDTINGYYHEWRSECIYSSRDLNDTVFIDSSIFNMLEYLRYNSTLGKFVGWTDHGIYNAEWFNNDTALLESMQSNVDKYCKPNAALYFSSIRDKKVKPKIKIKSVNPTSNSQPDMLKCSVYNFYPKTIKVSWLRDGEPVTSDVSSTDVISTGDWYYQIHSELVHNPKSGEKISCVVEHASFTEPMIYDWDPTDAASPESDSSETAKIVIGALALLLGIIVSAAGFIYYKKKSSRS